MYTSTSILFAPCFSTLGIVRSFYFNYSIGTMESYCGFKLHFLIMDELSNSSNGFLTILLSFWQSLFQVFGQKDSPPMHPCHDFWVVFFLHLWSSLYILKCHLLNIFIEKYFLLLYGLPSQSLVLSYNT